IQDVAVGGAGRFLLLHLADVKQLAVFDVNQAKIVGYIPVPEKQVVFTAGLNKVFVAYPELHLLQRWDLFTRQKEVTVPLAVPCGTPGHLYLGSGVRGPLLITWLHSWGGFSF